MENKRKQTRAYTITDESFNFLKAEAERQKRSASFIVEELIQAAAKKSHLPGFGLIDFNKF